MTDEQLQELIQETSESIDKLSDPEKPLTKEEKNRKQVLVLQREVLNRIKEAKDKGNWSQEIKSGIDYALLSSLGEKHPYLMYFLRSKFGWNVF